MSPSNVFLSPSFLPLLLYLAFLFPVFHSFCYVTPIFLPSICPSFPLPVFPSAGQEDYRSRLNGECFQDLVCPEKCRCEGTVVDCSNLKLTRVPPHIPEHTTDL